jgi:drug/metabolite transporter (DMT)-like permease
MNALVARRFSNLFGSTLLIFITMLWGSTFVIIKVILPDLPASAITFIRFAIAAAAFAVFIPRSGRIWRVGFELGGWLFAGYGSQAIGLRYTTANRSAFITCLNVIFVPILAAFFGRGVRPIIWAAAFTAVVGCALLCNDGSGWNIGDLWTLITAVTYAAYILRIERFAGDFPSLSLTVVQFVPVAIFSGIWTAADPRPIVHIPWPALIYLGLGATVITTWLQTVAQQVVPAPQAAVIFTLEPVFASLFSYVALQERLSPRAAAGAALILLAALSTVAASTQAAPIVKLPDSDYQSPSAAPRPR